MCLETIYTIFPQIKNVNERRALRVLICELCEAKGYLCDCKYCGERYVWSVMPAIVRENPNYETPKDWVLPTPMEYEEKMEEPKSKRPKNQK